MISHARAYKKMGAPLRSYAFHFPEFFMEEIKDRYIKHGDFHSMSDFIVCACVELHVRLQRELHEQRTEEE